jgi:hypothetical protein
MDDADFYLITLGGGARIRRFDGFSSSELGNIVAPTSGSTGVTIDKNGDIWSCEFNADVIYHHQGFSTTILGSFAAPAGLVSDITCTGDTLFTTTRSGGSKMWEHVGFTVSTVGNIVAPATRVSGITSDGTDTYSCDRNNRTIYHHQGFTTTILDSFVLASGKLPSGVGWEDYNSRVGLGFIPKVMII